ncbi:MAG: c-type cytochrome [Bdellovibrionales bacterium]|nr:c-type cytochrome [Bdellovibrionales bacterium]
MCVSRILRGAAAVAAFTCLGLSSAHALPWDQDMARQQSLKETEIARAPAVGTVPLARVPFTMTADEAGERLRNPVARDEASITRGRRLFSANCVACHGQTAAGDGPVAKFLAVPNITQAFYAGRPDGRIFGVITLGQNQMPRYGYKFSETSTWDVVNYVRYLQGLPVQGMSK